MSKTARRSKLTLSISRFLRRVEYAGVHHDLPLGTRDQTAHTRGVGP